MVLKLLLLEERKKTSDLISRYAGIRVPRNKRIVGQNAFSHESGIHQDGVLKHRETYEIMTPQLVGVSTTKNSIERCFGKHTFSEKLKALGYDIDKEAQIDLFKQFKAIADKRNLFQIEIFMRLLRFMSMSIKHFIIGNTTTTICL